MLRVKYSLKTMTPTMGTCSVLTILRRQSICSSVRHRTSSRRHFGLQIVQTSTQSIIKYMGCASAASLQQIQTVDELRQRIIEELEHLDQRVIDNAVKSGVNVFALARLRKASQQYQRPTKKTKTSRAQSVNS